jgi:hypothetical protein
MPVRRLCIALVILFVPTAAFADDHRALFGGAERGEGSSFWGWRGSFEISLTGESREVSAVGDYGIQWNEGVRRQLFMTGLRWAVPANVKNVVAVHALAGSVNVSEGGGTDGVVALGALWDYLPNRGDEGRSNWGIRVQADYVINLGDADNFTRVTAGLLYRW